MVRSLEDRFYAKVAYSDEGCWLWAGSKYANGYGEIKVDGKKAYAHRVAWALENGPIPAGASVLHHCDVRACVRHDHLFLGDHNANMADMKAKGRGRNAESDKTHCKNGHAFDEENTYVWRGMRCCRACRRAATARYSARTR
jgi:hypothetical protein